MEPKNIPASDLLKKYLDGSITESESMELFAFLKEQAPENNVAFEELLQKVYSESFAEKPALTEAASQRILDRLLGSVNHSAEVMTTAETTATPVHRVHFLRRSWLRYAAAAVLLVTISVIVFKTINKKETPSQAGNNQLASTETAIPSGTNRAVLKLANGQQIFLDSTQGNIVHNELFNVKNDSGKLDYEGRTEKVEYHTLSTPRGGQYKVRLPDGTNVWLNAASDITYPTAFTGNNRKVMIRGEAYFEVTKNKAMPFVVDVDGKATVEVLGTHFNINAYTDEQSINTTLLEGSVKVESAVGSRQSAMLKPGHQAQINQRNPDNIYVISDTDVEMVMAWRNGSFRFNRAHLDEVLRQLSRWYDVDVIYQQGVPAILVSGEIKRDLNLTQALMILDKMGVHSRIEGRKLVIMP